MIRRTLLVLGLVAALPGTATASVAHLVVPGETLWQIAAQDNLTPAALAAVNGLSPDAQIVSGTTLQIPPTTAATQAPAAGVPAAPAAAPTATQSAAPASGYTVRPGDTLSGLAASSGVSVSTLAAANGLDPTGLLIAGRTIRLGISSPAAPASAPAPATPVSSTATTAQATAGRVSAADIAAVAARNGVPPALASAIAWQESGFNNGLVSSAGARGVMQLLPGTWDWVQQNLARRRLNPFSPIDNVGAGVLYLGQLLRDSGGNPATAIAGYYQGPASVHGGAGILPETQQYVANVLALQSRFGG